VTNRETFNQYIRMVAEKQISFMENMSDEELIQRTIECRDYGVHIKVGDKLSYFKAMTAGMPVGDRQTVAVWLAEESGESIPWDKIL